MYVTTLQFPPIVLMLTLLLFTDLPTSIVSPARIIVNAGEVATFHCNASGVGDLTIEWDVGGVLHNNETCSESPTNCSINSESSDGYVTSILKITSVTDLNISCIVNQTLFSSEEPGVEIRQTTMGKVIQDTVQLYIGKKKCTRIVLL